MTFPKKMNRLPPPPPSIELADPTMRTFKIVVSTLIEYTVQGRDADDAYNALHNEDDYLHKRYLHEETISMEETTNNALLHD